MKKICLLFILSFLAIGLHENIQAQSKIVMNEIYAMGTSAAPDWIELYNPNTTAVDISGYKIYDVGGQGGTKPKKEIPAGTTISAKGFFVIVTDDGSASAFGLSSAGEDVWFENASGTLIDNTKFLVHTAAQSCARIPDGTGTWQVANTITRGTSNGGGTGVNDKNSVVNDFAVFQNYPNPFNPSTSISYMLPVSGRVIVSVYDVIGKEVSALVNEYQAAGLHSVNFDASSLSSGVYYYSVKSGSYLGTKKLLLLK